MMSDEIKHNKKTLSILIKAFAGVAGGRLAAPGPINKSFDVLIKSEPLAIPLRNRATMQWAFEKSPLPGFTTSLSEPFCKPSRMDRFRHISKHPIILIKSFWRSRNLFTKRFLVVEDKLRSEK